MPALKLLCEAAKSNGISYLYDNFEEDRKNALKIFEKVGFKIVEKTVWNKFNKPVSGVIVSKKL